MSEPTPVPTQPLTLYRPVWADPGFILSTNDVKTTDFDGVMSPVRVLAPANPKRWALGFLAASGTAVGWRVGPWNDPSIFGVLISTGNDVKWFTLFDFGPLVSLEWYGYPDNSSKIRVIEIEVG